MVVIPAKKKSDPPNITYKGQVSLNNFLSKNKVDNTDFFSCKSLYATGMDISVLSFGASSLGAEFRKIDFNEAVKSVHVALDQGMNFIDSSPYYGRGLSESPRRSNCCSLEK